MNFKTSIVMSCVLIVVLAGFIGIRASESARKPAKKTTASTNQYDKPLFEDPPKDLTKITCTVRGGQQWVFERVHPESDDSTAPAEWRMSEPFDAKVAGYLVDGIVSRVTGLKYQVRLKPGDPDAVTLAQAGLDTPKFSIRFDRSDGVSQTLHVGRSAANNKTYVRPGDDGDIFVVTTSLDTLLRKRPEEYRDKVMVKFDVDDAQEIEITSNHDNASSVHYRLVKHDRDGWVFEEPFNADADDNAIRTALNSFANLRAAEWVEATGNPPLGRYGLQRPRLDIEVVCRHLISKPESADEPDQPDTNANAGEAAADEAESKPEPEYETQRFHLLVASRSPLDKESNVFAKMADDNAIATITKVTADKFTPAVDKWRNMKVVRGSVQGATRIDLTARDGTSVTLVKDDVNLWTFKDSGDKAEQAAVNDLISKIDGLKALAFVDDIDPTHPELGLNPPYMSIVLVVPGEQAPVRVAVGDATDAASKRLYYVRAGLERTIAKVRAADVSILRRQPREYRNRSIVDIAVSAIKSIELMRTSPLTGKRESFTLEKKGTDTWQLVFPVHAPTDSIATTTLVTTVANLNAESVVAVQAPVEKYGLDDPDIELAVTYDDAPVAVVSADGAAKSPGDKSVDNAIAVILADHNNHIYAKRTNSSTIYRLSRGSYDSLFAEFRRKDVFDVDSQQIAGVEIVIGDRVNSFERREKDWVYATEPDLPIDAQKVTGLLLQLQDLKLERFVGYKVENLGDFGLDNPARKVTIRNSDGQAVTLLVSGKPCLAGRTQDLCAMIEGTSDVFLLTPDTVSRFDINIEDYESPAGS